MGMLGGVGACVRALRLGFALTLACGALGMHPGGIRAAPSSPEPALRAVLLSEDFEQGFPPAGWGEVESAPDPYNWEQTTEPAYVFAGNGGALVRWTGDHDQDESLTTPAVDLAGAPPADLYLSFWWHIPVWSLYLIGLLAFIFWSNKKQRQIQKEDGTFVDKQRQGNHGTERERQVGK